MRLRTVGGVLLASAACLLTASPVGSVLDHVTLDAMARWQRSPASRAGAEGIRGPGGAREQVVVVGIDEMSLERHPEPFALWHRPVGAFLGAMARAAPRAVVLDVVLPDRSRDDIVPGLDRALLAGFLALRRASVPVVVAQTIDTGGRTRALFAPVVSIAGPESIGLALVRPDPDGVVRRVDSVLETPEGSFRTIFGRACALLGLGEPQGLVDYALGPAIDYVPLHEVLDRAAAGDEAWLDASFAGRAVLLGTVQPFVDRSAVPLPLASFEPDSVRVPGVLVQAQALRSALGRGLVEEVAWPVRAVLVALALVPWWVARSRRALAAGVVAGMGLLAASWVGLRAGVWLPVGSALVGGGGALSARLAANAVSVWRERRTLEASFGRYVSPDVLGEILAGRLSPGSTGERRSVCVLFSDIRGFTTRSESQPPEAIIGLLNDYFEEMTAAVHRHGGTVDKFIGDGLMAFFGAPSPLPNPAQAAFDAAREMISRLDALNARLAARGVDALAIGVGLQFGDVVVGHVGSRARHEYTAIGDTVNTAARLEGLTKGLGYPVLCAAEAVAALDDPDTLVELGPQPVKGRADVPVHGWRPVDRTPGGSR